MKSSVGYSMEKSSFAAGAQAVYNAVQKSGMSCPDFFIGFCGGEHNFSDFFSGVRSVAGSETPIIGGSTIGIITNENISYTGYESGVAAIWLENVPFEIATVELGRDLTLSGEQLGLSFTKSHNSSALLFFYDSLEKPATELAPPVMNASPLIIEGIENGLGTDLLVLGAGLLSDFYFRVVPGQFCGDFSASGSMVGLLLGKGLKLYSRIIHGCNPLDGVYHLVTGSEGAVIHEIDGKPAVELIDGLYGHKSWRDKHPVDLLTIGVNHGEKYGQFDEKNYVNRLITGALPDRSGIAIFEADLSPGTEIQFMLRDGTRMIESAARNVAELMDEIGEDGAVPRFALYIDCAGRTSFMSNTLTEEAAEIQNVMNRHGIPLLGFYSGVEIAPCLGRSRGLDWTGVLIILAE